MHFPMPQFMGGINTMYSSITKMPLRWRHDGCDSVSNHQPRECLLRRLIRRTSKKTSKLCVTGLCAGNSPETGEFRAQMASNAENVSIWWRHHAVSRCTMDLEAHFDWSAHEIIFAYVHMNFMYISYDILSEFHINFIWTSYDLVPNFTINLYRRTLVNCMQTSCELHVNFIQITR